MANIFKLNIVSQDRETISLEAKSLYTKNSDGFIEFLANHTSIISSTIPTITTIEKSDGTKRRIFTSYGIISIKDNILNFCCDSVNLVEEIDKERAKKAKERAEKRLAENNQDIEIDIERAKRALARANARLEL